MKTLQKIISSQLLWVPARRGGGVLFTTLNVGAVPARLSTARHSLVQFLALQMRLFRVDLQTKF